MLQMKTHYPDAHRVEPVNRHTLAVVVDNEPGVLARIAGLFSGRVRALLDERGKPVKEAGPAIPVQVLGLTGVPMAGDQFLVVDDATQAREIAQRRERLDREAKSRRTSKGSVTLEDIRRDLGYEPAVSIDEGLARLAAWWAASREDGNRE